MFSRLFTAEKCQIIKLLYHTLKFLLVETQGFEHARLFNVHAIHKRELSEHSMWLTNSKLLNLKMSYYRENKRVVNSTNIKLVNNKLTKLLLTHLTIAPLSYDACSIFLLFSCLFIPSWNSQTKTQLIMIARALYVALRALLITAHDVNFIL